MVLSGTTYKKNFYFFPNLILAKQGCILFCCSLVTDLSFLFVSGLMAMLGKDSKPQLCIMINVPSFANKRLLTSDQISILILSISLSKDFTQSKDNIIKKHLPKKYPQPHCDACCWFAPGSSGSTVFHQKKSTIKMMYYYLMPLKKNPKKNYQNRELVSLSRTCNIPTM